MKASAFLRHLRSLPADIHTHAVCVADRKALEGGPGATATLYEIEGIEPDPSDNEICLVLEYPANDDRYPQNFAVSKLISHLAPLVSDNPDWTVIASVKLEVEVEGQVFSRFDMPILGMGGIKSQPFLILAADGFSHLSAEGD